MITDATLQHKDALVLIALICFHILAFLSLLVEDLKACIANTLSCQIFEGCRHLHQALTLPIHLAEMVERLGTTDIMIHYGHIVWHKEAD